MLRHAEVDEAHLLQTYLENTPDHVYFKDVDSRFTRISRSLARCFGLEDADQAIGFTDFDFFADEHACAARSAELDVMSTGRHIAALEEREVWPDGRVSWVSTTKAPLLDQAGQIVGIFGLSRDITARKLSEERERHQADQLAALAGELTKLTLHDELTGLLNRRGLEQMGNQALNDARDAGSDVCVLFADLDGLKAINDGYGHRAGDRALMAVGSQLRAAVRSADVVGRIGGDEFAAVLVGLSPSQVEALCERVHLAIAAESSDHPISASIGISTLCAGDLDCLDDLLTAADRAMYESRHARSVSPRGL